jgi:hypothetical protein
MFMGNSYDSAMPFGPSGLRRATGRGGPGSQFQGRRQVEEVCGYQTVLTFSDYFQAYDRQDIATRIVETYPDYTWMQSPEVYESEGAKDTKFEKTWAKHLSESTPFVHLHRLDVIAGIGSFGILLFGVNDGKKISTPLDEAEFTDSKARRKVIYFRPYMEGEVEITAWDTNPSSPRYGKPVMYKVKPSELKGDMVKGKFPSEFDVHYTRVLHFADNPVNSDIFGVPRLRRMYDRCADILKIVAGSAEMFWKGAYSGWSFVMDADAEIGEDKKTEMKKNIEAFMQGLDRYLLLQGVTPTSHAPSASSPSDHLDAQLTMVSIATKIPKRILTGSEMAKLASTQDALNWSKQIKTRRGNRAVPYLVMPYVEFCIRNGIVRPPNVENSLKINWPDLDVPSEIDNSETALNLTNALVAYTNNALYNVMPFDAYLVNVWNVPPERAAELAKHVDLEEIKKLKEKETSKGSATTGPAKGATDLKRGGAKSAEALAS